MTNRRGLTVTAFLAFVTLIGASATAYAGGTDPYGNEDPNKKVLKQGLLGAGTGAIAAGASGGKAGQGALIGAGTNVIGGALLDTLTAPSTPAPQYAPQPVYSQQPQYVQQSQYSQQPQYGQQQTSYYADPPQQAVYQQPQPVYYQQPAPAQPNPSTNILKQGLLGAGTGAIAAGASGGKAGKGALIGAGTNVIGGALLDMMTTPSKPAQPQPVYYQQPPQQYYQQQPYQQSSGQPLQKKIIRKYDAEGNVISEEEVYQ